MTCLKLIGRGITKQLVIAMSKRVGYGQRRLWVTAEVLEWMFVKQQRPPVDLPEDARFVRQYPRKEGDYWFVFESKEWDELEEGEEIPQIDAHGELVDHE